MSAHRRPGPFGEAPLRRRAATVRGRRRARSPGTPLLVVLLGVAMLGIGVMISPNVVGGWMPTDSGAAERMRRAALPADAPEQGLVYEGLRPAPEDSLCPGAYQMDGQNCTHGPDEPPAGMTVRRDVPAVTASAPEPEQPRREAPQPPRDTEILRDEGGTAPTSVAPALVPDAAPGEADFVLGPHGVACEGDGRRGKRVQVLYLHEFGTPSRFSGYVGSIRTWTAGVDQIYDASAAETGGSRHVRFVTTPQCRVDVAEVQVPAGGLASFTATIAALQGLGYNRTDRKYLLFADSNVYCGIATFVADRRPGPGNRNNGGPSYGRVDAGCWGAPMAAHELTHMLGAVLMDSPNATGAGRCTDDHDLLCGRDRSGETVRTVCPRSHEHRLDCGHDDYFHTDPEPDSYLARAFNVAQSAFLLRSDGGADAPGAPESPAPGDPAPQVPGQPQPGPPGAGPPTGSTGPPDGGPAPGGPQGPQSPGQNPGGAPGDGAPGGPPGEPAPGDQPPSDQRPGATAPADATPGPPAGQPPGDDGRPPAAEPGPGGRPAPAVTTVATPAPTASSDGPPAQAVLEVRDATSTSVRLSWNAAAPEATYQVSVDGVPVGTTDATRARLIGLRPDAAYRVEVRSPRHGYAARSGARTAPAARPARNTWFVLTNSLTGGAADLYAARTANGAPVVLGDAEGDAQKQWKLVPAADGTYALVSRATGKCVVPLDGNPVAGTPLVQRDCTPDDARRWSLQASDHGFTLCTTVGGLVAGVGTQRFGEHRLLVLQPGDGSRHQSWTAVPG